MEENPDVATWTHQQIADAIGAANRDAVGRDLREIAKPMIVENARTREEAKRQQLRTFELIELALVEGKVAPDIAREWLHVRSEISKLLGLNAESRSAHLRVNIDATTDSTSEFARWKRATAGLSEAVKASELTRIEALPRDVPVIEPMQRQIGDGHAD